MLIPLLAHAGEPLAGHDLCRAWNLDPPLVLGVFVLGWAYWRGHVRTARRDGDTRRAWWFTAALVTIVIALVSPLDALSHALASAHMVQHVLLLLVAAPLMALSSPTGPLLRGSPTIVRRATGRWRKRLSLTRARVRALRHPAFVWGLHVATIWFWHAAVPYDMALKMDIVHVVEHVSFLVTGVLFWHIVLGVRQGVSNGLGILLVFTMSMQSIFLSALLTFASAPWYSGYEFSTRPWGLDPLADQQLAGVIMWIPAGLVYLGAALALLVGWIRASDRETVLI
jgi:putative membrane protein